ncbi:hypothetical protein [Caballeronia sp. Lep1P3]|uniref:hypothetical protein n=1 Tax=Caballeronia sp. Lep1P3 TaxID=2878150 RepID=UPI001FD259B0|nr:hypothetical protein [Caballeronia sp. Lep1P3]
MNDAALSPKSVALDARMLDASRFPLVRVRGRAAEPGHAFAWGAQMRRILSLATPFVIVADHADGETPENFRLRAAWLRTHRAPLAAHCRGFIVIEPRIEARATARETLRALTEGSGVRTVVVSSLRVANELAPVLLKHATAPGGATAAQSRAR